MSKKFLISILVLICFITLASVSAEITAHKILCQMIAVQQMLIHQV